MDTRQIEEKLWEYIDGISNKVERLDIEVLLETKPEWKLKYDELLQLHQMIHSTELEEPSMRFTQNVMEEITKYHVAPATRTYLNKKIIYGIGGFFVAMIVGLLIYSFAQLDLSSGNTSSGISINFSKIEWNKLWNNGYTNIFMMINVVLALMLLDKYLDKRKRNEA